MTTRNITYRLYKKKMKENKILFLIIKINKSFCFLIKKNYYLFTLKYLHTLLFLKIINWIFKKKLTNFNFFSIVFLSYILCVLYDYLLYVVIFLFNGLNKMIKTNKYKNMKHYKIETKKVLKGELWWLWYGVKKRKGKWC